MQKKYECETCDADFKISHTLDESYYEVNFCPFCGAQIDSEDEEDTDEYE